LEDRPRHHQPGPGVGPHLSGKGRLAACSCPGRPRCWRLPMDAG
jgi:hypothetical protein